MRDSCLFYWCWRNCYHHCLNILYNNGWVLRKNVLKHKFYTSYPLAIFPKKFWQIYIILGNDLYVFCCCLFSCCCFLCVFCIVCFSVLFFCFFFLLLCFFLFCFVFCLFVICLYFACFCCFCLYFVLFLKKHLTWPDYRLLHENIWFLLNM